MALVIPGGTTTRGRYQHQSGARPASQQGAERKGARVPRAMCSGRERERERRRRRQRLPAPHVEGSLWAMMSFLRAAAAAASSCKRQRLTGTTPDKSEGKVDV
uniref:Uncharacterized protein n=1 Tax=Oryza brachyantha TaxID=4533 RepID=J3M9Q7_ORYBR